MSEEVSHFNIEHFLLHSSQNPFFASFCLTSFHIDGRGCIFPMERDVCWVPLRLYEEFRPL